MKSMEANWSLQKKKNSSSNSKTHMTKEEKKLKKKEQKKLKHQVKSRFYYIFWGTATAAVVLGQLYVGSGYRSMAEGVNKLTWGLSRALR